LLYSDRLQATSLLVMNGRAAIMIATRHILSAATIALAFGVVAGEAQAFGRMGMGMGMGMGMRGPMGMGMGMGMRGHMGMGSRSMYLSSPPAGYRRSHRSRDYVEDAPPPRPVKQQRAKHAPPAAAKVVAPAKAPVPQVVSKPVMQTRTLPQYQPVQPAQLVQPAQVNQVPQTVQAPTQPVQPTPTVAPAAPVGADNAMPARLTPDTRPLNCMTKLHLKDGTVLLQDFCTLEQHVIKHGDKPQSQTVTPAAPSPAPPQQVRQGETPSQLARTR
jgi:hypothetical protein